MVKLTDIIDEELSVNEGKRTAFMTDDEQKLKKRLIALLKNDGKGHHHAKYAARLADYDVNIVPIGKEPSTAAISFDEGVIYINKGFLRDPATFGQLNVIMRHELCHNLLMHQFRMINKVAKDIPELNLRTSQSIHSMFNALEDFEISNKKYSKEDKETVKNLWINGKVISGLVTEDHRYDWQQMSVEQMYDAICAEIEKYGNTGKVDKTPAGIESNLNAYAAGMHQFKRTNNTKADYYTLKEFHDALLAPARKYDKNAKLPDNYENIFTVVQKNILDDPRVEYTSTDLQKMWQEIGNAKAIGKHDVVSPVTGEVLLKLYTPEEKELAAEVLKTAAGYNSYQDDFDAWYAEILRKLDGNPDFTPEQIKELSDILND